jgi:hypothetical protein
MHQAITLFVDTAALMFSNAERNHTSYPESVLTMQCLLDYLFFQIQPLQIKLPTFLLVLLTALPWPRTTAFPE